MAKILTDTLGEVGSGTSTASNVSSPVIDLPLRHSLAITRELTRPPETPTMIGSNLLPHESMPETIGEDNVIPATTDHKRKLDTGGYESNDTSEAEYRDEAMNAIYRNTPLNRLGSRMKKKRRRFLQHGLYVSLIEDRITSLEESVRLLASKHNKMDTQISDSSDEETLKLSFESQVAKVNRVGREGFKEEQSIALGGVEVYRSTLPWHRSERKPVLYTHAIDVLVSEAHVSNNGRGRKLKRGHAIYSASEPADYSTMPNESDVLVQTPQRIRINSNLLLLTLERITKQKFTTIYRDRLVWPLVFLRPFKLFVQFEQEIRNYTTMLADKHKAAAAEGTESGIESTLGHTDQKTDHSISPRKLQAATNRNDSRLLEDFEDEPTESEEALRDLQLLIEVFAFDLKGLFDLRHRIQNGTAKMIAFADLWHLFSHGDVVCTPQCTQAYRILHFIGGREYLSGRRGFAAVRDDADGDDDEDHAQYAVQGREMEIPFTIQCLYYDFDGKRYGPKESTFRIRSYEGEIPITSLKVFPIKFCVDAAKLKNGFVQQGRRFVESSSVAHMQYTGQSLDHPREEIDSQIMVDFALALQKNSTREPRRQWTVTLGLKSQLESDIRETKEESTWTQHMGKPCNNQACCDNDYIHQDHMLDSQRNQRFLEEQGEALQPTESVEELADEERMLLPSRVYGFILRSRRWACLDVAKMQDIESLDAGLDALKLLPTYTDTLLALVKNHSRDTRSTVGRTKADQGDLVPGKGKGLIILLHGEPGVGKTTTAECIAAHTKRPLFPITCGDIGETAERVETSLENNFQLAHKWGCVLLLDEADVFLQRRNKTDLQRNSIVSVFLRVLEYYSGILFLTTNRIGTIDPAFKSRIHMSLNYPRLSQKITKEIWDWHINRVSRAKPDLMIDTKEIKKWAKTHYKELEKEHSVWNGRQIRNAFQTALALAEYDSVKINEKHGIKDAKPHLEAKHFEQVATASKGFDMYLRRTWGGQSDADRARRAEERADRRAEAPSAKMSTSRHQHVAIIQPDRSSAPRVSDSSSSDEDSQDNDEENDSKDETEPPARPRSSKDR